MARRPGGVPWELPTPIFIEPLNGFGADVAVSVTRQATPTSPEHSTLLLVRHHSCPF